MKNQTFLLLIILALASGCKNPTRNIEITPDIMISIPQKSELTIKDSVNFVKIWQTAIDDDHFAIFSYSINQQDPSNTEGQKEAFKKNIEAFIQTFDFRNIDSSFIYRDKFMQSDLTFDYLSNENKYRFFGRFLVTEQNFIAFCFQSPFPVDNYSKSIKNKLFTSIEIK